MTSKSITGDLVPIADRLRWMMMCRVGLVAVLAVAWFGASVPQVRPDVVFIVLACWLAVNTGGMFAANLGRRAAFTAFTVGLLGDGLLLDTAWWVLGAFDGWGGYLIILHLLAVTLIASFPTGLKLALWHSITLLLIMEANGAGLLGPAKPLMLRGLTGFLTVTWITVLATAAFAAMNERELRRRRYDSEALRKFGIALALEPNERAVAVALTNFARHELLIDRCAVLVFPRSRETNSTEGGFAAVIDGGLPASLAKLSSVAPAGSTLRWAIDNATTTLSARLDSEADGWLSTTLPDAQQLIIVPFALDQVTGALVMEHRARSVRRFGPPRVARRLVNTAEQAAVQAALAIGRCILTERLRAAAETDGLTGVANRRQFDTSLAANLERASASSGQLSVALIDLDHFKQLNDRHGHLIGDEALKAAAGAIAKVCGDRHLVGRYGGEEFATIFVDTDLGTAEKMAEQIRRAIASADSPVPLSASVGVASCPAHGTHAAALLSAADAALYEAKAAGRDRVRTAVTPDGDFHPAGSLVST